ncbi:hypothetical protein EU528_12610 [Candidatus Thorarchaeota archaeon]|nr:MAG: hypothetical protein EU528_12610 [Candidatus Thorarchaeota archaeon]
MSKSAREIPKVIAAFGEKQFKETGAAAVEVLRVKAAVMRKHFRQLKGIVFLVAVISLDRVRVYFFNAAGVMVIGENLDTSIYSTIRRSSKLIAKFEKPKVLTQEELRIEATQDLRDSLGKAIRRVTRFLAAKEPSFPDIFVVRTKDEELTQNFGLHISPDFEFIFEESVLSQNWTEGVLIRSAFLLHLQKEHWSDENAGSIGNGLALVLLKDPIRNHWIQQWKKQSKGTPWFPVVSHFQEHQETYGSEVFNWLGSIIRGTPLNTKPDSWIRSLATVHDSVVVPIGTSDYHALDGFCKTLGNPNQLVKRRHVMESIHLAPRVFCDGTDLGIVISLSIADKDQVDAWATVKVAAGTKFQSLIIGTDKEEPIDELEYFLNLEDIYPSTTGPISHGLDIVRRALGKLGISSIPTSTFESRLELKKGRSLEAKEIAVLERLLIGDLEIISNTLVGSPHIVKRLLEKGCIVFVPDFNHLGIEPNFVIHGSYDAVQIISRTTLEATLFKSDSEAYAVVSAPSSWRRPLIESAYDSSLDIWPILSTRSERRLLRDERLFVEGKSLFRWSDGTS